MDWLGSVLGTSLVSSVRLAGGDINDVFRCSLADGGTVVIKTHHDPPDGFFEAEADGLERLRDRSPLRVPKILAVNRHGLVLEDLGEGQRTPDGEDALGRGLAILHEACGEGPGLECNNYIATLPQRNEGRGRSWARFFLEERVLPLASELGLGTEARHLQQNLGDCISDAPIALLHGDLWAGNVHWDRANEPCLIDPAVYRGDPEIDLAMMNLFGGFSARVTAAYQKHRPPRKGWERRRRLYQIPPLLVHARLFGGSYLAQARAAMGQHG